MKMSDAVRTERGIDEAAQIHYLDSTNSKIQLHLLYSLLFFLFFSLLCNYFKVNLRHFTYIFHTIHYTSLKHVDFFLYNHNAIVMPNKINHFFFLVSFNNQSIRFSEMSLKYPFTDALFQSEHRGSPYIWLLCF